jgi:hypothetical protein
MNLSEDLIVVCDVVFGSIRSEAMTVRRMKEIAKIRARKSLMEEKHLADCLDLICGVKLLHKYETVKMGSEFKI